MKYKAYVEVLDLPFFYQMQDLIVRSTESASGVREKRSFFGKKVPKQTMEDQYGLRYPGEVLERFQERRGEGRTVLCAAALALADKKDILEENMFVGSQKEAFLRKLRAYAGKDIYLSGALYILSEKESERERLKEILLGYPFCTTQEVLYVLSVFRGERSVWEQLYPALVSFLGKGRTIKVYENEGVFSWFIDVFDKEVKECRGKDADILKALRELPFHHVKPDGKAGLRLRENGYSEQEIIYLNLKIPLMSELDGSLAEGSIVMERIAATGCQSLLNAEILEDEILFKLCIDMLKKYQRFEIKLEGFPGLMELLKNRISVRNVDLYCYLFSLRTEERLPETWFQIELVAEPRWDELASRMQREEYRGLFEECFLAKDKKDVDSWLDNYERLVGERYETIFWNEERRDAKIIFKELISQDKLDVADLFCQYVADEKIMAEDKRKEKWNTMLQYIQEAGRKLYCHGIFQLWEKIITAYGILSLDQFMENKDLLALAVNDGSYWGSSYGYYREREYFWKNLDFLDKEESTKLFFWAEEYFYKKKPEYYNDFLYAFIKNKAQILLSAEDGRALMDVIIDTLPKESSRINELRELFYEPEEWEAYQLQEKERKKKEDEEARRNKMIKWNEELMAELQNVGAETGKCLLIGKKLREVKYGDKSKRKLYCEILVQELQKERILAPKEEIVELAEELVSLLEYDFLDWKSFREIIENMEVSADESTVDKTA